MHASHHITSHHITSHHITSYHITSHYITLHYITLHTYIQICLLTTCYILYIRDGQTYPKRFLPEPFEAYWVLTESYWVLLSATVSYWVRVGIASGRFVHPWYTSREHLRGLAKCCGLLLQCWNINRCRGNTNIAKYKYVKINVEIYIKIYNRCWNINIADCCFNVEI